MFPTRQSLGVMKAKLKGAETGHSLLKRKSEALTKYAQLAVIPHIEKGRLTLAPQPLGASEVLLTSRP